MKEVIGRGLLSGIYFTCCTNAEPLPFRCSNCGLIMAYCIESDDLFPNPHDPTEFTSEVNALDSSRPAFACPRCGHVFEYYFTSNPAYAVTREELVSEGLAHILFGA